MKLLTLTIACALAAPVAQADLVDDIKDAITDARSDSITTASVATSDEIRRSHVSRAIRLAINPTWYKCETVIDGKHYACKYNENNTLKRMAVRATREVK